MGMRGSCWRRTGSASSTGRPSSRGRCWPSAVTTAGPASASPYDCAVLTLRVLDLSRVLAGPYCTMLLGDLGADVVKVERPGTGDDTRAWGPPWRDGESTYYLSLDRNKRSRVLARTLGERADVLIESFRPGLMASWGLDGDTLRRANPRLVSCSVTAFGS